MHYVQAGGDVPLPGVYAFPSAPSMDELMVKAGGHSSGAQGTDPHPIFSNGERLDVKRVGGAAQFRRGEMNGFYKMTLGIPLCINTESEAGLSALPDVGPTLARVMVEERSRRGGFKSLEDLTTIPGIGSQRFLKIRPFLKP
jgi:competence protein ComEA